MYVCFISLIYGLVSLLNISLILIYYNGYISLNKGIILAYMAICFYMYVQSTLYLFLYGYIFFYAVVYLFIFRQ